MMDFPVNLQTDIDNARLTLLQRRAYVEMINPAFAAECLDVSVEPSAISDFAENATDLQREQFFQKAPAEIAAAFVLCLKEGDRAKIIAKLAAFDQALFSKLLEGL